MTRTQKRFVAALLAVNFGLIGWLWAIVRGDPNPEKHLQLPGTPMGWAATSADG